MAFSVEGRGFVWQQMELCVFRCVAPFGAAHFFDFQGVIMPNYEKLYFTLFNVLADAIDSIDEKNYDEARGLLIETLQKAEDIYIESGEETK